MTSRILRVSKRGAIILLIAAFSIAGIIACGGNDATNPSSSSQGGISTGGNTGGVIPPMEKTNITIITNTGNVTNGGSSGGNTGGSENLGDNNGDYNSSTWNVAETKGKAFYGASYRSIYVPWISPNWFRVSYNDTDRLTRMWKAMIDRGVKDGNRRLYIKTRDGDLFFDANYNVRWSKKPDVIMKRFQGGAMVQLREGYGNNEQSAREYDYRYSGSYALSGLYTFADSLYEVNRKYGSESLNYFFNWKYKTTGHGYQLAPEHQQYVAQSAGGAMELLVLHPGYPVDLGTGKYFVGRTGTPADWSGTAYAVQTYKEKNQTDIGYRDGNHHLYNIKGNTPERYMPAMGVHQLYHLGYRWATDKTYSPDNFN